MKINIKECYRDYNTCGFSEQKVKCFDSREEAIRFLSKDKDLPILELGKSWARFRKPYERLEVVSASDKYGLISRREGDIDLLKGLVAYTL
jgi:hypothetical protein